MNRKDKRLYTPGPLNTHSKVKESMLCDLGSRDYEFMSIVNEVRKELLTIASVSQEKGYESIIMQGAGTFGIESVLTSCIPETGKLLIIINGAYGRRMQKIAEIHNMPVITIQYEEDETPSAKDIDELIQNEMDISHVAIVHCETTTGIMNDIESIGSVVKKHKAVYIVDAMSSFGAVPIDIESCGIDFLISSSNKCIEGVPGFSFILCKKEELLKTEHLSRTLSLDLYDQWKALEDSGQFRFTPPIQTIAAFHTALKLLNDEGGVEGRGKRYAENKKTLSAGMRELGFQEYLKLDKQSYIISSFLYPEDVNFNFELFYSKLNERGFVIYPGKLSQIDCFRIGSIGQIFTKDIEDLLAAIKDVLLEMKIKQN